MAFGSHARVDADGRGPDPIASLPTKATAIRAVGVCSVRARSPTRFPNGVINEHSGQRGGVGH